MSSDEKTKYVSRWSGPAISDEHQAAMDAYDHIRSGLLDERDRLQAMIDEGERQLAVVLEVLRNMDQDAYSIDGLDPDVISAYAEAARQYPEGQDT